MAGRMRGGLVLLGKRRSSFSFSVSRSSLCPFRVLSNSSSTSSTATISLLKALRKEIQNAQHTDIASFEDKKKLPAPFTISDKPGEQEVYLHRTYGDEDISIACFFQTESFALEECDNQQKGEDSGNQTLHLIQMIINIKKVGGGDNPYLELICRSYGDEPVIQSVIYKQNDLSPEELPYEGPNFLDLDKNLKVGFVRYLLIRGIDARLGDFMLQYMYNKKHLEHLRWLHNVESFFKESDV